MKQTFLLFLALYFCMFSIYAQRATSDDIAVKGDTLTIQPVMHASLVLTYHNKTIYIDPSGGKNAFTRLAEPDIILITDIHGDHFDVKTLEVLTTSKAVFIVPQAVADKLPPTLEKQKVVVLNNEEKTMQQGIAIKAVPMYNLPQTPDAYHIKGRGNGYVLTIGDKNIYISGDTEDIPEMRALKNIDVAFVCMNLPYTMDVQQAAAGVLAFKPRIVYPYHYRGQDVATFKTLVNTADKDIEVRLRNWYPAVE